jgi:hypothetical protein
MLKFLNKIWIISAFIIFLINSQLIFAGDDLKENKLNKALDEALQCIKMTKEDLVLRTDYLEQDFFRLPAINGLMKNPLFTLPYSEIIAKNLAESGSSPYNLVTQGFKTLSSQTDEIVSVDLSYLDSAKVFLELTQDKKFKKLPKELQEALKTLYKGIIFCNGKISENISNQDTTKLTEKELDSLRNCFPKLLLEDVNDEFKSVDQLDGEAKDEENLTKELTPILKKVDLQKIYEGSKVLCLNVESALNLIKEYLLLNRSITVDSKTNFFFEKMTSLGEIIIGGYGSSDYSGAPLIVIDLGGDDKYNLQRGEQRIFSSVVIDLSGDDIYRAETDFALASGFLGSGILLDVYGNDTYLAKNFSLGSGIFGSGILIDQNGDDKYSGDIFTQGAGSFGMGILSDLKGNDQYSGALYSQGFGFTKGCGALIDSSGNDNYFAGGKYKDILRYKDHYMSLSQGFAYGIRPIMSGGIGFLVDLKGNDIYTSDIFGQGSSYWWSLGSLIDFEGNDKYVSYQYAQGAATHMTLGTLIDKSGDDVYISHGVSQGCGHDFASGILWDLLGNDYYITYDLSQGAGSANGIGILMDEKGDDNYYVGRKDNTQGYGNPRREFGSIGILIDMGGKDNYNGLGQDNTYWTTPSKWGGGIDGEF